MGVHQIHFGKKFYQDKITGYWISTVCHKIRAHRWVWNQVKGSIPKGCHIHHIDEDKSNNSIENLRLMGRSEHLRLHMTPEKREISSRRAGEIRHLTKEWHASEEGKAWHKYHAIKCKFGKNDPRKVRCNQCLKEYETTKISRAFFCSNACKSKFRRHHGFDDVVRICPTCEKEFMANKYSKKTYCSRYCAQNKSKHV